MVTALSLFPLWCLFLAGERLSISETTGKIYVRILMGVLVKALLFYSPGAGGGGGGAQGEGKQKRNVKNIPACGVGSQREGGGASSTLATQRFWLSLSHLSRAISVPALATRNGKGQLGSLGGPRKPSAWTCPTSIREWDQSLRHGGIDHPFLRAFPSSSPFLHPLSSPLCPGWNIRRARRNIMHHAGTHTFLPHK